MGEKLDELLRREDIRALLKGFEDTRALRGPRSPTSSARRLKCAWPATRYVAIHVTHLLSSMLDVLQVQLFDILLTNPMP